MYNKYKEKELYNWLWFLVYYQYLIIRLNYWSTKTVKCWYDKYQYYTAYIGDTVTDTNTDAHRGV